MIFWAIITLVSLLVASILGLAFRRGGTSGTSIDVYRDQLAEVDRDLARGTLTEEEADRTRLEVSRRLLEADRAASADPGAAKGPVRAAALGTGLAVVALALAGYRLLGSPDYPDQPRDARLAFADQLRAERPRQDAAEARFGTPFTPPKDADASFLDLMDKLRDAVKQRPDDPQGWTLLARNEAGLQNYAAAWKAQAQLVRLEGDAASADDMAAQGSLMVLAAGGFVSPEAEDIFVRALKKDPANGVATYYIGLMYLQTDRPDLAFRFWDPLLRRSPADAPWVPPIRAQIETAAQLAGIRYQLPPAPEGPALPGPSAGDVEAAGQMSDADRQDMIRSMVRRLEERLASDGGSAEEWARLITALGVLGEKDHAQAIYGEARAKFAADPEGLASITAAAAQAGLDG